MIGARVTGMNLPDALSTPSGMPDVSADTTEAANAQLLWRAIRETIRHGDQPAATVEVRGGAKGLLWRGNPQSVAERLWDGLDRSQLADETLAALYAYLHRTGRLSRVDTGNKSRQWWVADDWYHPEPPPDVQRQVAVAAVVAEETRRDDAEPPPSHLQAGAKLDYAVALQGLLDEHQKIKEELKRALAMASLSGGTMEDLSAEVISLRGMCAELRENNRRLREENAAYRTIVDQPIVDESYDS